MIKTIMVALALFALTGCGQEQSPEQALVEYFDAVATGSPNEIYRMTASKHKREKAVFLTEYIKNNTTDSFRVFLRDNTSRDFISVDIDGDYALISYIETAPNIVPALHELIKQGKATGNSSDFDLLAAKLTKDGFDSGKHTKEVVMALEVGGWKVVPTEHMHN